MSLALTRRERPPTIALAAGNGGVALIGVLLPGRFDDAMRVAVVRRYPGCPAGVRALCLSLVMLGLVDSAALAPLVSVGAGTAALIGSGVATWQALAVAISVAALGVFSGAAVFLSAVIWRTGVSLLPRMAAS